MTDLGQFDYDWWALALESRFFNEAFDGEPVTLCVDEQELASMTALPPVEAIEALASAVRTVVMPNYRFEVVRRRAEKWQRSGFVGPPPALPLLALTVLAASRMSSHGGRGAPAFYPRVRELLRPGDTSAGDPGDYANAVPRLWEQLRHWLEDELAGTRGLPTITMHPHFVNVGYSLQQAVLRTADRRRIYQFLRSIRFEPGETVLASELRRALSIWARRRGHDRLAGLADDSRYTEYAEALLARIAATWDGRLRDEVTGVRTLPVLLTLQSRPRALAFTLLREPDLPKELVLRFPNGAESLTSPSENWYEPNPLPIELTAERLNDGFKLAGDLVGAFFEPADVYVLQHNDDLVQPVQRSKIHYGEKHFLIVRANLAPVVERWIAQEQLEGLIDKGAASWLPPGWALIRDFRISARPATTPPRALADMLGSSGGSRLRLVGGLPLPGMPGTYLTRGAPMIALPSDSENRTVSLECNGFDPIRLRAVDGDYPLTALSLVPGTYRVVHDRGTVTFDLIDGLTDSPNGEVGGLRLVGFEGRSAAGLHAQVPHPCEPATVPMGGAEIVVIVGAKDDEFRTVRRPAWLEKYAGGALSWTRIDAWVPFAPVWALLWRKGKPLEARPIGDIAPGPIDPNSAYAQRLRGAELWARADVLAAQRWSRYLAACEAANG